VKSRRLLETTRPEADADLSYGLYRQGREKIKLGRLEEAVELLNASLKVAGHPKTAELLGECFMKLGRLGDAEWMLKQAVSLGRESRAPLLLAELSILQGRAKYAKEMLVESLRRNPTYNPAMRLLARLEQNR
jgi:lipopolysaccharide biosynthesis regulator YciM